MSLAEFDEGRPAKKRRFFVEEEPEPLPSLLKDPTHHDQVSSPSASDRPQSAGHDSTAQGFDRHLLEAFIGEPLSDDTVEKLRSQSDNDVQRAINMYLDGSWAAAAASAQMLSEAPTPALPEHPRRPQTPPRASMPDKRYIGAFGAIGWATRSGSSLVKYGDKVTIARAKTQSFAKSARGGKVAGLNKRQDTVVRFINSQHEEVGRLETESSAWIAPLLDQNICRFEGTCVYAPPSIRTNDTIYLQLKAFLLKKAFFDNAFTQSPEKNRKTGIFEARETQEERDLHLRQIALVKLFNEIKLHPSKSNAMTEKHKRQGLLKVAEAEEQKQQQQASSGASGGENGGSTSTPEDSEDGEELEQDQLDTLYQKAQSFDFNTPEYEPAATFAMELRKYQKQALHWMIGKERDSNSRREDMSMHPLWEEYIWPEKDADDQPLLFVQGCSTFYVNPYSGELSLNFPLQEQNCLGGILADEMGLGKTIEMLSLIHSNKSEVASQLQDGPAQSVNNLPRLPSTSSDIISAPCTTLVVGPMTLLAQWQSEAERASKPGTLKTLLYYGSDKALNLQTLCCEENAENAPNVIITSYGTVLSEFSKIASGGGLRGSHGGLFSLRYFRVILDEAHNIKNRQSKTAKACYEISAVHRWVLTGTPIINRLEDLFSLVHFLKVEPWSNFSFWKTFITVPFESKDFIKALDVVQTVLEPLVLRRTKDMKTPDGEALVPLPPRSIDIEKVELSENERDVYNLIFGRAKRTFAANVEAGTLMKSYTTIFAQILRLRQACCHPVLVRNKNIVADEEDAAAAIDAANGLADDMDLAALIERFQVQESEQDANKFGAHALKQIQDEAEDECPICAEEPMIEQTVTGCWHSACKKCLIDYINHQREKQELPRCFSCREPINIRDIFEVVRREPNRSFFQPKKKVIGQSDDNELENEEESASTTTEISLRRVNQQSSAKIGALLHHLTTNRRNSPSSKAVIFSQFTSFLDLIEPVLDRAQIPFLRLDGTMAQKNRAAVIASFSSEAEHQKNPGTVMLLSLRTGGVGLNLTVADRVYMMDPWWSFAVEAQAIDRVHRMGQDKEVRVIRFIVEESIEEKMLKIQERKKFIASSLGMMSEVERKIQRLEDIRELLS